MNIITKMADCILLQPAIFNYPKSFVALSAQQFFKLFFFNFQPTGQYFRHLIKALFRVLVIASGHHCVPEHPLGSGILADASAVHPPCLILFVDEPPHQQIGLHL